jgi:hypothetical protein
VASLLLALIITLAGISSIIITRAVGESYYRIFGGNFSQIGPWPRLLSGHYLVPIAIGVAFLVVASLSWSAARRRNMVDPMGMGAPYAPQAVARKGFASGLVTDRLIHYLLGSRSSRRLLPRAVAMPRPGPSGRPLVDMSERPFVATAVRASMTQQATRRRGSEVVDGMEALRVAVAVFVAVLGISGILWLNVYLIRRNRRILREHPERVPYGKKLALRGSPFIALLVAGGVYGVAVDDPVLVFFAVAGVAAFAVELIRRWQPPTPRS